LLQESKQIFEFSSLLFSSKLSNGQLKLDDEFKLIHVGLTDVQVSFKHHVEQVIHVFEVVVNPFITFFEFLPVVKLLIRCSSMLFSVLYEFLIFWEHVQFVTTHTVDVVVEVESSVPPLFV